MLDWQSILDRATELTHDHWMKVVGWGAALAFSTLWAFFWAWRSWRTRQDMDVIHVSQNTIVSRPSGANGAQELWLILDVHFEDPMEQVISHPMPRRLIRRAAKKTTESQPFLVFPAHDRWYVLKAMQPDWLKGKDSQFCMNVRLNVPL